MTRRELKYGELKRRRQLCCAFLTCSLLISILACTLFPVIINGVVKSDFVITLWLDPRNLGFDCLWIAYTGMIFYTSPLSTLESVRNARGCQTCGGMVRRVRKYQYRYNVTWTNRTTRCSIDNTTLRLWRWTTESRRTVDSTRTMSRYWPWIWHFLRCNHRSEMYWHCVWLSSLEGRFWSSLR